MECPRCALLNPESAQRCDCGYDFVTRRLESSYLTDKERPGSVRSTANRRAWLIETIGAPALGAVCTFVVLYSAIFETGARRHDGGLDDPLMIVYTAVADAAGIIVGLALMTRERSRKLGTLVCAVAVGSAILIAVLFGVSWLIVLG